MASREPTGSPPQPTSQTRAEVQQEIATRLKTLHDLGPEYTDTVAVALMEQIDPLVEAKVRQILQEQGGGRAEVVSEKRKLVSTILGLSIPLIAIAGGIAGKTASP